MSIATRARRLHVVHRSAYSYVGLVDASFNEVRMTPATFEGQRLVSHDLKVSPECPVQEYTDYWGAVVECFDVHVPHGVLEVVSTSTVDVDHERSRAGSVTWEKVRSVTVQDRWAEYAARTSYVDDARDDSERRPVVKAMAAQATPAHAVDFAVEEVRSRLTYTPGATTVSTTAGEAWAHGQGVCQDFTHVTLSLLRAVGIPARYVSGYLHAEHVEPGVTVSGESHAWVEYWDGGWKSVDPTNDRPVGSCHVVVSRGRDYVDVLPLKGIYAGARSEMARVVVEITELSD